VRRRDGGRTQGRAVSMRDAVVPGGGLLRQLAVWRAGFLLLLLAGLLIWQLVSVYRDLARLQDERILAWLDGMALRGAGSLPAEGVWHRFSALSGEWVAGEPRLPPYPWKFPSHGSLPDLYIGHLGPQLVRVAARPVVAGAAGEVRIVQVAEVLSHRFPGVGAGWQPTNQAAIVVLALVALAAIWDMRRIAVALRRARQAAEAPLDELDDAHVVSELKPIITRNRQLAREQRAWADEQRRFVANASHQLRTPMAVLRTQLQAALAGDVPKVEVLTQMLHTVDRASCMADQLLSLTRLEQLKQQGEHRPVDVREVARHAVMELAPLIAAKRLDFSLGDDGFKAQAHAGMLGELLRNLLANAIHHAPERAQVGIVLRRVGSRRELIVWDDGPGIDDALRPRLFQPFAAGKGGLGLGLSICRQIAEAMGADVWLHNRTDRGRVIGVDAIVSWRDSPS
jgi:two-component system, OmpR family, sensor histidine kinase TctE